ncbi:MAG: O-antigen ligase family protein [Lachnospiraceae bacterium]|nr:O-antigen ligase family protein [Lachnospiraceae bacterium]
MKKYYCIFVQWYIEAILILSPLIVTDYYANITATKSWFFVISSGVIALITFIFIKEAGKLLRLNPVVLCALAFIVLSTISLKLSPYGGGFSMGSGRSMGVLFFSACAVCLLVLTNVTVRDKVLVWGTFAAEAVVVCIAVLNFCGVDFLGFVSAVPKFARGRYLSTIGYGNYLSQYVSMVAAMEIAKLLTGPAGQGAKGSSQGKRAENVLREAFRRLDRSTYILLGLLFLSYVGLIVSASSGGFIGLLFAVSLAPFFIREKSAYRRLGLAFLPFPFACLFGKLLFEFTVLGVGARGDQIVRVLMKWPVMIALVLAAAAVFSWLVWGKRMRGKVKKAGGASGGAGKGKASGKGTDPHARFRTIYGIIYAAAAAAGAVVMILSNTGVLATALTVTDSFASNRGFIWKESLRLFADAPILQKLFGVGPDKLLQYYTANIGEARMMEAAGQIFDSPHNFMLYYLLTGGILGLLAVLSGIALGVREVVQNRRESAFLFFLPFACCMIQAMVVPSTPIVIPIALVCFAAAYERAGEPGDGKNT